jgi:hypothetical protein
VRRFTPDDSRTEATSRLRISSRQMVLQTKIQLLDAQDKKRVQHEENQSKKRVEH